MGSMPRRARQPIPTSPVMHCRRVMAGCAVLLLLGHLLLAQLTLGLAVAFTVTGRVSRWRWWWLTGPAAAGLIWALAIGPGPAAAGFAAGPARILGYLARRDPPAGLSRPSGPFAGAGSWLPGQLPIALIAAAAEAALIGWLGWRRIDEQTVRPPRPGLLAAIRTRLAASLIRAGGVVTRQGCALGVAPATGAVVELRWPEMAGGVLLAGTEGRQVTVTGLQVVHAALRRRKPLIVVDVSADTAVARALAAACAATGTPLRHESADADLDRVISERSAVLLSVGSAELAARACADISMLAAGLGRIGVDGDGLIWVTGGERLPKSAVAALIGDGRTAGLVVVIGTASAEAAADLAGLAATLLVHRITDPFQAVTLGQALAGVTGISPGTSAPRPGAGGVGADAGGGPAGAGGLAPRPTPSAGILPTLGRGEFVLAVNGPRRRTVTRGRLVPARLPRPPAAGQERLWRRLRYDPA
jgi:hypothetical protein